MPGPGGKKNLTEEQLAQIFSAELPNDPGLSGDQLDVLANIPISYDDEPAETYELDDTSPGLVNPLTWSGKPIPVREWLCEGLVPYHVPTMLSGMGGIGKTLLGMQLVHAAATGLPWLNQKIKRTKAFAVFCEDDEDEVHRRFNDINTGTNTSFDDLGDLRLWVRDGMVSSLMEYEGRYGAGKYTQFFYDLIAEIKGFGAELILLDSLYNFFHGNENDRVQVTQFVGALRHIAKDTNAALVFLAHPSKSGLSTGDGYAGSTAWHDAVRSRLYFAEEEDAASGEKRLLLSTMKANYAAKGDAIEVHYDAGMLVAKAAPETTISQKVQAEFVFLKCLREANRIGRQVSDKSRSSNYAPKRFAAMGIGYGFKAKDFERAMQALFDQNRIHLAEYTDAYRNKSQGIFEAPKPESESVDWGLD